MRVNSKELEFDKIFDLGRTHYQENQFIQARSIFEKCLSIQNTSLDKFKKIDLLLFIAYTNIQLQSYKVSLDYLNKALELCEFKLLENKISDKRGYLKLKLVVLFCLSNTNMYLNNIEQAKNSFSLIYKLITNEENIEIKFDLLEEFIIKCFQNNFLKLSNKKSTLEEIDNLRKEINIVAIAIIQSKFQSIFKTAFKSSTLCQWVKILNDKWFEVHFKGQKYSNILSIVDNNLIIIINNKSIDKIKSHLEVEFKKISETDKFEKFINDLKKRVDTISDFYSKIPRFIVFKSKMKNEFPFRENLPKIVIKSSYSSRPNSVLFKDYGYQSVHLGSNNNSITRDIFSPVNRNNNLVKNKSQNETTSSNKERNVNNTPNINYIQNHLFSSSPKIKNTDHTNYYSKENENLRIIYRKKSEITLKGTSSVLCSKNDSTNQNKGKRVLLNLKSALTRKTNINNKNPSFLNGNNNLKLLKTFNNNKCSSVDIEKIVNYQDNFYRKLFKRIKEKYSEFERDKIIFNLNQPNLITNYSFRTCAGKKSNNLVEKVNQDTFFINENFMRIKDFFFCGVCDGHGVSGDLISAHTKQIYPLNLLLIHINKCLSNDLYCNNDIEITEQNIKTFYEKEFSLTNLNLSSFCNSISEALIKTHEDLNEFNIDYKLSGSTLSSIFVYGNTILCANLGDSRAIVGLEENNKWTAVALSDDHKPSKKEEKKRIFSCQGRIEPYKDLSNEEIGPERVWLKDENSPGLAISRSIGDEIAKSVGVICEPGRDMLKVDITEYLITTKDKFIILATDGVWEYISNELAVEIVSKFYVKNEYNAAAESLVKIARSQWEKNNDGIDDITCVIIFLDSVTNTNVKN